MPRAKTRAAFRAAGGGLARTLRASIRMRAEIRGGLQRLHGGDHGQRGPHRADLPGAFRAGGQMPRQRRGHGRAVIQGLGVRQKRLPRRMPPEIW